jgi:FAM76 protein
MEHFSAFRCTSSEQKYGSAVKCEICQQMCAFNRQDHRVDGKLHCWLCKLSYKRALAKAKKSDSDKNRHKKRSADEALKTSSSHKMGNSGSSHNRSSNSQRTDLSKTNLSEIPEKIPKIANSGMIPSNSDHVVAINLLREQIATLQKKLQQKDNQLLQKDKEVSLSLVPSCVLSCFFSLTWRAQFSTNSLLDEPSNGDFLFSLCDDDDNQTQNPPKNTPKIQQVTDNNSSPTHPTSPHI